MTKPDLIPKSADRNIVQSIALVWQTEQRVSEARAQLVKTHRSEERNRRMLATMSERIIAMHQDMRA
ncbi:MAG: hypothetical protein AAFN94_09230 [Pseudomonadota bacterium]